MVDLIIWSKDRPCQLHAFLKSVQLYANEVFSSINVIYNYSNDAYKEGYKLLQEEMMYDEFITVDGPSYHFYWENLVGMKATTLSVLEYCKSEWVCFSTDDELMVKLVDKTKLAKALPKQENHIFSLRLGYNTIDQDIHLGTKQAPLNIHTNKDGILTWPIAFYRPDFNYGYFGSLDMNIYRRSLINRIINFDWKNTNQLEGGWSTLRHECDYISSFEESVAVNIPANNMSMYTKAGQYFPFTTEELNEKFLAGKRIDIEKTLKGVEITGSHQEIMYEF
jgi:hypothetical protein